ncbi:hypothetical protein BSU04_33175 [Caballeronia sordidicola]|uniref:Uncharacterized protein n=1 Tax=Caballeronia sordidicola TaxID=196367 RepID=A0A226WSK8_CABSO|nr:hypothetical protein BSU04_33175 [Caballeronia sordidicola]
MTAVFDAAVVARFFVGLCFAGTGDSTVRTVRTVRIRPGMRTLRLAELDVWVRTISTLSTFKTWNSRSMLADSGFASSWA